MTAFLACEVTWELHFRVEKSWLRWIALIGAMAIMAYTSKPEKTLESQNGGELCCSTGSSPAATGTQLPASAFSTDTK